MTHEVYERQPSLLASETFVRIPLQILSFVELKKNMQLDTFFTQLPTLINRAIPGITGLTLYLVNTVLYLPEFRYLLRLGGNSAVLTMCNIPPLSLEAKILSDPTAD